MDKVVGYVVDKAIRICIAWRTVVVSVVILLALILIMINEHNKALLEPDVIAEFMSTSDCHERMSLEIIEKNAAFRNADVMFVNQQCSKKEMAAALVESVEEARMNRR